LRKQGNLDAAAEALGKAIEYDPQLARWRLELGFVLVKQGYLREASESFRKAIELGDVAWGHWHLGHVLLRLNKFPEALDTLRRGHEFLLRDPNSRNARVWVQFIRRFERMRDLNPRLEDILAGKAQSADPAERVVVADLCLICRDLPTTVVLYYSVAFASEPQLTDPTNRDRYIAACAAPRAVTGSGRDVPAAAGERSRLRKQALDWLRADLSAHRSLENPEYTFLMLQH
jgi:tetratricopeptide (TPR) repeat protein